MTDSLPSDEVVPTDKWHALLYWTNKTLQHYMPMFTDSRTVDDCLVGLAHAAMEVEGLATPSTPQFCSMMTEPPYLKEPKRCGFKAVESINGKGFCKPHAKLIRNNLRLFT